MNCIELKFLETIPVQSSNFEKKINLMILFQNINIKTDFYQLFKYINTDVIVVNSLKQCCFIDAFSNNSTILIL